MHPSKPHTKNSRSTVRAMLGRELRLFAREVPASLLIAALLGLFCVLAASALSHGVDSGYTPAPIAIVDGDSSFTSSIAISMLSAQNFAAPLEIVKTNEEKAEQGLRDGTFSAALYLPRGYASDIMTGTESAARLVISESVPLHADVVKLLCSFGEELLSAGQYGIFAGENLVWSIAPDRHEAYLRKANTRYLSQAFSGPELIREQVPYALTGVDAGSWYLLMYAAAFFQLMILGCFFLTRDWNTPMLRRLAAEGVKDRVILGCKFAVLLGLYICLAAAALSVLKLWLSIAGAAALFAALIASASVGLALILCLPRSHAVTAAAALSAAGLISSGGILPRMELPEAVTAFGDFLPLGAAARLGAALMSGTFSPGRFLPALIWTLLAWMAMVLSLRRMRKGGAV